MVALSALSPREQFESRQRLGRQNDVWVACRLVNSTELVVSVPVIALAESNDIVSCRIDPKSVPFWGATFDGILRIMPIPTAGEALLSLRSWQQRHAVRTRFCFHIEHQWQNI